MTHFLSFVVKVLDGERQYSAPERVKQVNSDSHESVLCSCTLRRAAETSVNTEDICGRSGRHSLESTEQVLIKKV